MTTVSDGCAHWRSLASCRQDGELDELQTTSLEKHLQECPACRSWTQELAELSMFLRDSERVEPVWSLELGRRTLRRRVARAAAASATAASAAAVAAFAFGVPLSGLAHFSSSDVRVSAAPCTSCTKKALAANVLATTAVASGPVHVLNPLLKQ